MPSLILPSGTFSFKNFRRLRRGPCPRDDPISSSGIFWPISPGNFDWRSTFSLGRASSGMGEGERRRFLPILYEAVIGALYLDSGYDQSLEIIRDHFRPYLNSETPRSFFNDYKSHLQEHAQQYYRVSPRYQVVEESGPDHDKRFQATVLIGQEDRGEGGERAKRRRSRKPPRRPSKKLTITKHQSSNNNQSPNSNSQTHLITG